MKKYLFAFLLFSFGFCQIEQSEFLAIELMLLKRGNKIIKEKSLLSSLGTDLAAISTELIKMNKPATFNYANATQNGN
jgi:hypothetical protein